MTINELQVQIDALRDITYDLQRKLKKKADAARKLSVNHLVGKCFKYSYTLSARGSTTYNRVLSIDERGFTCKVAMFRTETGAYPNHGYGLVSMETEMFLANANWSEISLAEYRLSFKNWMATTREFLSIRGD